MTRRTTKVAGPRLLEAIEWLAGDECHETDDAGLVAGIGRRLRDAGLPLDRLVLHLRTLHPELFARTVAWAPDQPVEIRDRAHGIEIEPLFARSPLRHVMEAREAAVLRPDEAAGAALTRIDVFAGRGLAEIVVMPLSNADGPVNAVSFGTTRREGFGLDGQAALGRVLPALRSATELRTLRQTELTLLDTYIGSSTARRILAGRVRRGQVESLDAALMLCDLRGFTALSKRLPPEQVLALLDSYFDRVIPAIAASGGEVLKFMGDAVLAFFHRDDAAEACAAALAAARSALTALDRLAGPEGPVRAGIALHYGRASYGNIGSGRRLDFAVIGPDVNLVSRIEAVCSETGQPLLMSDRFAGLLDGVQTAPIGARALKGFVAPVPLHRLDEFAGPAADREFAQSVLMPPSSTSSAPSA